MGEVDLLKPKQSALTREALEAFLDSVALKPGNDLVVDLSEVQFIASAVLSQLITLKKRVNHVGGRFTIRHTQPDLMEVFRITHLDHVFEFES